MNLTAPILAFFIGILPSYEAAKGKAYPAIITVRHANPDAIAKVLQQIYQGQPKGPIVKLLPQSGRIVIDADPKLTTEVSELVKMLDIKNKNPTPEKVIRLTRPPARRDP